MTRPELPRCLGCGRPLLVIWGRELCAGVGCPRHGQGADPDVFDDHEAGDGPQKDTTR
jgi:hypothetical protein